MNKHETIVNRKIYIAKLEECETHWDTEAAHSVADDVLCHLLIKLGYEDVVDKWNRVPKWYA